MNELARKRHFPPVVDARTRVLVLGSLPGEASLQAGRYYANPRNGFWALIGAVIRCDLVGMDYEARLAALLERGVGLWDTVAEAERTGSLDADIRNARAADPPGLAATLPELRALAFNGAAAAKTGVRALGEGAGRWTLVTLPSSSPARAIPFEAKLAEWTALRTFLD